MRLTWHSNRAHYLVIADGWGGSGGRRKKRKEGSASTKKKNRKMSGWGPIVTTRLEGGKKSFSSEEGRHCLSVEGRGKPIIKTTGKEKEREAWNRVQSLS